MRWPEFTMYLAWLHGTSFNLAVLTIMFRHGFRLPCVNLLDKQCCVNDLCVYYLGLIYTLDWDPILLQFIYIFKLPP